MVCLETGSVKAINFNKSVNDLSELSSIFAVFPGRNDRQSVYPAGKH